MHPLHEKGWEKWTLVDFRGPISTPFCGIFFLVLVFLTIASVAQDEREVLCVLSQHDVKNMLGWGFIG